MQNKIGVLISSFELNLHYVSLLNNAELSNKRHHLNLSWRNQIFHIKKVVESNITNYNKIVKRLTFEIRNRVFP